MALRKKTTKPAFAAAPVKAQAGGASQIGSLYTYQVGAGVQAALTVPTISRARDLIVSMVGSLMLRQYSHVNTPAGGELVELPLETWMSRPDPSVTPGFIYSRTASDLFMVGRAFWYVTSRYATGFPASFQWLPAANMSTEDQAGPFWFGPSDKLRFNGQPLDSQHVIQFLSPIDGILATGQRAIDIAIRLDQAARRFATNEIAAGYLQQTSGEPMSGEELSDLAAGWSAARRTNAIGALNEYVKFVEFTADPSKLQLQEGREHAALELSRVANIPPYLVGISTGGMTYQNAQQARQDLFLFGAKPYIQCIEQTLSLPNVLPRGRHVEFDVDTYLESWNLSELDPISEDA
jgi:phage portal protein BeeE